MPFLALTLYLKAQDNKLITVKAGTRMLNYFPEEERYRYPAFMEGQVQFKDGNVSTGWFNYNFLSGEMEYIQSTSVPLMILSGWLTI